MKKLISLFMLGLTLFSLSPAQTSSTPENNESEDRVDGLKVRLVAELGNLNVLSNKIQLSQNGTYFDYRKDGGQEVLFPFARLSTEIQHKRNIFILLYQPLRIESQSLLTEDQVFDSLTFPAGTNLKSLYNFPFYRISYMRELFPDHENFKFAIGATVQIRNATIEFESLDGSLFRTNKGVGIVPALKFRISYSIAPQFFVESEVDGMYAPVSYLNGDDNEIVGAILDASLRGGTTLPPSEKLFLNVRYLGGGAVGIDDDDTGPGDGYVKNWLNFLTVSVGLMHEF